jgi:hypothetical protein
MIENLIKPFAIKAFTHTNGPGSGNQAPIFADLWGKCKLVCEMSGPTLKTHRESELNYPSSDRFPEGLLTSAFSAGGQAR